MPLPRLAAPALGLALFLGTLPASLQAAWPLASEASEVHFVSVKQDHLAEHHRFRELDGHLYESGRAVITVDLASVATGIPVRDQRMRRDFFEVGEHPQARLKVRVEMAELTALAPGESLRRAIRGKLRLHGRNRSLRAKVTVVRRPDGGFRVLSRAPVVLDVRDFGLAPGVALLRRMAGLDRISYAVPVTFAL